MDGDCGMIFADGGGVVDGRCGGTSEGEGVDLESCKIVVKVDALVWIVTDFYVQPCIVRIVIITRALILILMIVVIIIVAAVVIIISAARSNIECVGGGGVGGRRWWYVT